jgi:hypothetical protein
MTERYGPGSGDEGQRPSGRGAVTERLARPPSGAHEIDLTDEATASAAADEDGREASDPFEPAADTRPGASNIFDVDERDQQEEQHPTGYEPPVADPDADRPREASDDSGEITPTPVPAADPPAGTPVPEGLPEPPSPAAAVPAEATPAAEGAQAPLGSLDAAAIRNRFVDIQAGFVDEPRQAVEEAGRFVDHHVHQVADALRQQRGQLAGPEGSTEDLRLALRAYRQFVDRLLGLAS